MKKLIWAIMQIILGCCGLLMVIGRFVKMSQIPRNNLLLGLIISVWLVPGILTGGIRSAYAQLILEMCGFEHSNNYDQSYWNWCVDGEVE